MSSSRRATRWLCLLLASSLSFAGLMQSAQAALIGTETVAAVQAAEQAGGNQADGRTFLTQALQREDVVAALQQRGLSADEAKARVAALSDEQAQWLAAQVDQAPAGAGDILGALVFIFVLLLITDVLGLTKVFPFTRSVR